MLKQIAYALTFILLTAGSVVNGQDNADAKVGGFDQNIGSSVASSAGSALDSALDSSRGPLDNNAGLSGLEPKPQPSISPESSPDFNAASRSEGLVSSAGNTGMVAGSCLVIDALVQQFCATNPNDISCQF